MGDTGNLWGLNYGNQAKEKINAGFLPSGRPHCHSSKQWCMQGGIESPEPPLPPPLFSKRLSLRFALKHNEICTKFVMFMIQNITKNGIALIFQVSEKGVVQ